MHARIVTAATAAAFLVLATSSTAARADTAPFAYTGGSQDWTVPAGVHQASFDMLGAQGGSGFCLNWGAGGCGVTPGGAGGLGARLQTVIAVNPGDTLKIRIGGAGGNGSQVVSGVSLGAGTAGFNGGSAGGVGIHNANGSGGGGGGGATDVRTSADTLADRILVSAGGGGGGAGGRGSNSSNSQNACPGHTNQGESGGAGGNSGTDGHAGSYGNAAFGTKGTSGAGGTGGTAATPGSGNGSNGDDSTGGAGGHAGIASPDGTGAGGGGGGGLYAAGGGGGGAYASGGCPSGAVFYDWYPGAGGGGGASYAAAPIGTPTVTDGSATGNGALTISYEVQPDVTTGAASATTTAGASVAGTVNPNLKATTFHVEYGTSAPAYGSSTTESPAGSDSTAGPVTANLTGLAPSTLYHYRVVATTCGGCPDGTDIGDDAIFTTDSPAPPPPAPPAGAAATGQQAVALAECKKKKSKKSRKKCKKKAAKLPI